MCVFHLFRNTMVAHQTIVMFTCIKTRLDGEGGSLDHCDVYLYRNTP